MRSPATKGEPVHLGLRLVNLPPPTFSGFTAVAPTLQRSQELLPAFRMPDGSLNFRCIARVAVDDATGEPVFSGPWCFGAREDRFLYLSWDGERRGKRLMFRRLRVRLSGLSWDAIQAAWATPGGYLEGMVHGRAQDGGPAFDASEPVGGWTLKQDD